MTDDRRLQRAILLFEQSNFNGAEEELRRFLLEDPENPFGHALLGLCLSNREAYEEAEEEARLAIHYGPDMGLPHYANASILQDRNRFAEALDSIRVALEIEPDNANFYALQGSLFMSQRRWSDALESADRGLQFDAESQSCANLRAAALVKLGRHTEADQAIDGMLARTPNDAYAHANQGWSLLHQNDHDRAREHFREALRLDPNLDWARAGMLESLKARNLLYRMLLKFFLAMSKLSQQGQWAIILGLFLGFRLLRELAKTWPQLAPYVVPILVLYIGFAVFTWIGGPLFNLLLRMDSFGAYVLSEDERRESNVFGLVLVLAITLGVLAAIFGGYFIWAAIVATLLLLPICATFRCEKGWPRNAMTVYTLVVALIGVAGFVNDNVLVVFFLGCFLSSLAGNFLAMQVPQK